MGKKGIVFLRISKPEFNRDLYENDKLYMNSQTFFREDGSLTVGQSDHAEGLVSTFPMELRFSTDNMQTRSKPIPITSLSRNVNAYIYCFYVILGENLVPTEKKGEYTYTLSWDDYLSKFWIENSDNELLLTPSISQLCSCFEEAATKENRDMSIGFVKYDLEEKQKDPAYFEEVRKEGLTVVFHKSETHKAECEYRFAVICPEKPHHCELYLENTSGIEYYVLPLEKERSVRLVFKDVELNGDGEVSKISPIIGAELI